MQIKNNKGIIFVPELNTRPGNTRILKPCKGGDGLRICLKLNSRGYYPAQSIGRQAGECSLTLKRG
jgi:hypothetical protein